MAVSGPSPESRVHALWLLHAYSKLDAAEVLTAMKDADPRVRENALQLSEPFLESSPTLENAVIASTANPDPHV
jgi:hypothetical protein